MTKKYIPTIVCVMSLFGNFGDSAFAGNWNKSKKHTDPFDATHIEAIKAELNLTKSFADDFFVSEIENTSCRVDGDFEKRFASTQGFLEVSPDAMYSKSTSLTIAFEYIAQPMHDLLANVYTSVAIKDYKSQKRLSKQLVEIAKANVMYDWMDWESASRNGSCWSSPDSKCEMHYPEIVQAAAGGLIIAAVILREHFSDLEIQTLDAYFDSMHVKFIQPLAFQHAKSGFTANANGGFSNLAFAAWKRDEEMFLDEIAFRTWQMNSMITDEGYIEGNSWRGVRDFWYHTLGADQMYSYALLAKNNGIDLFEHPLLKTKFRALAETTLMGNKNKSAFSKKGYRGSNYTTRKNAARPHVHQEAVNLPSILHYEFDVDLILEPEFFKRKSNQINIGVGFNSSCAYGFDPAYEDPTSTTISHLIAANLEGEQLSCKFKLEKTGKNKPGRPFGYKKLDGKLDIIDGWLKPKNIDWFVGSRGMKVRPNTNPLVDTMRLAVKDNGSLTGSFETFGSRTAKHTRTLKTDRLYTHEPYPNASGLTQFEGKHSFVYPIPDKRPHPDIFELTIFQCEK